MENNQGMEIINNLAIRIAELEIQIAALKSENEVLRKEGAEKVGDES